jgi:outer membrane protein assembly factor BamB
VSAAPALSIFERRPLPPQGKAAFFIFGSGVRMSFAIRNLSVLAYAQGFTLWHYKTAASSLAETASSGFFDGASDMLAPGDMMMVSGRDGGRIVVVAVANGSVATVPLG